MATFLNCRQCLDSKSRALCIVLSTSTMYVGLCCGQADNSTVVRSDLTRHYRGPLLAISALSSPPLIVHLCQHAPTLLLLATVCNVQTTIGVTRTIKGGGGKGYNYRGVWGVENV